LELLVEDWNGFPALPIENPPPIGADIFDGFETKGFDEDEVGNRVFDGTTAVANGNGDGPAVPPNGTATGILGPFPNPLRLLRLLSALTKAGGLRLLKLL
jgi:hypothetical protein